MNTSKSQHQQWQAADDVITAAPEIPRRFRLYPYQIIGIPLLLLIPALALLGVLGDSRETVVISADGLTLSVAFPSSTRAETNGEIQVTARNDTNEAIDRAAVAFDRVYVDGMAQISASPGVTAITDVAYIIQIGSIPAGETRVVTLDFVFIRQGSQGGLIRLTGDGQALIETEVSTFVLP